MNKLIVITLLSISGFLLSFLEKEYPKDRIQSSIEKGIHELHGSLEQFIDAVQDDQTMLLPYYFNLRDHYKNIETYVVFRYPNIDKKINGGPVPSVETEIVILHMDEPHGMQVLEELLSQQSLDKKLILKELKLLDAQISTLDQAFHSLTLSHWEILEANHLALTRLMTLGLSGFDSPELARTLFDAQTLLNQINRDISQFQPYLKGVENMQIFQRLCEGAISYIDHTKSIDELKNYELYRDYLVPLQTVIKIIHKETGFETFDEASTVPRSIASGQHLFATNYLNPLASAKGNLHSLDQRQVALGKVLFYDPILSSNNKRACSSCHASSMAFTDGNVKSINYNKDGYVSRNSPTLINSAYQNNFFWDLRSQDINDQIMHVFQSKEEFNTSADEIISKIKQSEEYSNLFAQAFNSFNNPISMATIKSALEMYLRSITALNSKFDRNIRKEVNSFTAQEVEGANLFLGKAACATCHFAPIFNGFVPPHFQDTEGEILGIETSPNSGVLDADNGMYNRFRLVYKDATYVKGMFKTSTIRNIEYTAPYMHNGAYKTLEEVVSFYNDGGGSGRGLYIPQQTLASDSLRLDKQEELALVAFMKTLSDTTGLVTQPFVLPKFNTKLDQRVWGGEY